MIRKVKKVKKLKKDKKIKEFYSKFRDIVFKNIKKDNFALAVSGGSDRG